MSLLLLFFLAGQEIILQMSSSSPDVPQKKIIFPSEVTQSDSPSRRSSPQMVGPVIRGMGQRKIAISQGAQDLSTAPNRAKEK
ncbi:Uncharacterized protein FKW44_018952, partial [Caligus rogercresseyi]